VLTVAAVVTTISMHLISILGHQECVTQQEYGNLRHFVANGGTMIILDGNVFYTEVKYNKNMPDNTVTNSSSI
jgi:hypothetical protein